MPTCGPPLVLPPALKRSGPPGGRGYLAALLTCGPLPATALERGAQSEGAHKWARWLHNPCCLGGPHRFRAGGKIKGGPQVGKVAT